MHLQLYFYIELLFSLQLVFSLAEHGNYNEHLESLRFLFL